MFKPSQSIELLDRKFNFICELSGKDFFLELERFVLFVQKDSTLRAYVQLYYERTRNLFDETRKTQLDIALRLKLLRQRITSLFPELDDSNMPIPQNTEDWFTSDFRVSFAAFDLAHSKLTSEYSDTEHLSFDTKSISYLLSILVHKVGLCPSTEEKEGLLLDQYNLGNEIAFLLNEYANHTRRSPEMCLLSLIRLAQSINPFPKRFMILNDVAIEAFQSVFPKEDRIYTMPSVIVREDKDDQQIVTTWKLIFRRAYEGLRADSGATLAHYTFLQARYKARCMYYDRDRIERIIESSIGREEDALTADLALYLFDNGISTLYRVRRGVHEFDLFEVVGDRSVTHIFIEAKVYKDDKAKNVIIKGLAQLHSYLNGRETESLYTEEVYLVIYRLGGPLVDLPGVIKTNRRLFYPIIIDLGKSVESGSRQSKPIYLREEDFFKAIEEE